MDHSVSSHSWLLEADQPEEAAVSTSRRAGIASKFLAFARARAVGADRTRTMREGRFSTHPEASAPSLFGAADMAYAAHILGLLDAFSDAEGRIAWADGVLAFQDEDGWFRAGDRQGHGVEHATAYALGAVQLLTGNDPSPLRPLKPLLGLVGQIDRSPGRERAPFTLGLLDRTHFWRGSHRAGGIAAIIGALRDLGLSAHALPGVDDATSWLEGWWEHFTHRVDPCSGYWRLSPLPLQTAFDLFYRRRHDPVLARMGGAVHLYWIAEKIGAPMPQPAALIGATAALAGVDGLYEGEPYCIDLDANFLIGRALAQIDPEHPAAERARRALLRNREAVVAWFDARAPEQWNASSHKLPGAFAAVAEADRALAPPERRAWRDVFERVWWL